MAKKGFNIPDFSTDLHFPRPRFFWTSALQQKFQKYSKVLEWDNTFDTSELQLLYWKPIRFANYPTKKMTV